MGLTLAQLNEMDLFVKEAEKAVNWVRDEFAKEMGIQLDWRGRPGEVRSFDSPIEALFFIWWNALHTMRHVTFGTYLAPQQQVEACGNRYRLDFQVMPEQMRESRWKVDGYLTPRVCVELDGHDFHERSKEQVAHRNQRDRDLQSDGWMVLHYSGSEIVRDPTTAISDCDRKSEDAFWKIDQTIIDRMADHR